MPLKVKFGGPVVKFLPADATGNQVNIAEVKGLTVRTLLDDLEIPADQPLLVIVNSVVVPQEAYSSTALSNDDDVSLMPPIQAG